MPKEKVKAKKKLEEYLPEAIRAAFGAKKTTPSALSKELGRDASAIGKILNGTDGYHSSVKFRESIADALAPDIDWQEALYRDKEKSGEPDMLVGVAISPETRMRVAASESARSEVAR